MLKFICIIIALMIVGALVFLYFQGEKEERNGGLSEPAKEFKIGMTMEETKKVITEEYAIEQAAVEYRENPSQEELNTTEEFMIELKQKGMTLHFNHNRVLIRIENHAVNLKSDKK